jgi:hypothetical protein
VLATLPPPLGASSATNPGLIVNASLALGQVIQGLLSHLPPPLVIPAEEMMKSTAVPEVQKQEITTVPDLSAAAVVAPQSPPETSADVLIGAVKALPAGLEGIGELVESGYLSIPEAAGLLTSGLLDTAGAALAPIITDVVLHAPSPIGGTTGGVAQGAAVLNEVVADIQEKITPVLSTQVNKQQSISGGASSATASTGPLAKIKLPAGPKLNLAKLNPLNANDKKELESGTTATGDSTTTGTGTAGTTNPISNPLKNLHLPAPGKISVSELTKKLGLNPPAAEKKEAAAASSSDDAAK